MRCVVHPNEEALFNCYLCRNPICVDCATERQGHSVCPICLARFKERKEAEIQAEMRDPRYPCAVTMGLLAAVATAFAWSQFALMMSARLDLLSLPLGLVVAYAVMWGAGRKRGLQLQQIAALLTLGGVLLGYYLILLRVYPQVYTSIATSTTPGTAALYAFPGFLGELGVPSWISLAAAIALAWYLPQPRKA